ncbi:methyl-accepting chemotaxis protein [Oxalobacteraceae bacterium GrIS 2.11]
MNIANIKIGARLWLGYGLVLALLAGVAIMGIAGMSRSNEALQHIVDVNVRKMALLEDMSNSIHIVSRVIRTIALLDDETEATIQREKIQVAHEKYDEAYNALVKMPLDEKGKAFVASFREEAETVRPLNNKFMDMAKTDKAAATTFLLKTTGPATSKWLDDIRAFIELQRAKSKKDEEAAATTYEQSRLLMIALSLMAAAIASAAAWLITKSVVTPITRAVAIARQVAAGDLTSTIESSSSDETGQLISALGEMGDSLKNIVGQVRSGTETISTATQQIASGNMDLSSRTEQQASALEETASSMEELTSTVKQNADNARQANNLAASASNIAIRGSAVVSQVVETMGSINDSSKKIVDIIGVIDGIAFQTNILALNAAVEAARAGEQGRGFAVVASEVRNLAQRSASAAKEIKTLIGDSVDKVNAGTQLVDQAGNTMQEIVESIRRVTDIMTEISLASSEQSAGIDQINQAITQMDDVTQQNAALVEEAASAAQSLQDQAQDLNQVVSVFKLNDSRPVSRAFPAAHVIPIRKSHGKNGSPDLNPNTKRIANSSCTSDSAVTEF